MRQTSRNWLILPPIISLAKDVVAAVIVLSTEPGITAQAKFYYSLSLFPGPLFVNSATPAIFVNVLFAELIGLSAYLCLRFDKISLFIIPPLGFLLKDILATAIAILLNQPGTNTQPSRFYSIAMLPGSALHRFMEPMLFNVLFAALVGLGLYLFFRKRRTVVPG